MAVNNLKSGIDQMVAEATQQNVVRDALQKPYKTFGGKSHFIKPIDEFGKMLEGNPKANFTIFSRQEDGDFDLGSAYGDYFETEEQAKNVIDGWERHFMEKNK